MEITDLQSQAVLKNEFKQSPLLVYIKHTSSFSKIRNIAAKYYSMLGSTYVCQQSFLILNKIKTHIGHA